jgi:hypothetical protein
VKGVKTFVGVPSIVIGWFAGTEMTVSWPGASGLCEKEVARNRKQHNTNRADIDRFVISHEASLHLDTQFPWLAAASSPPDRPDATPGSTSSPAGSHPHQVCPYCSAVNLFPGVPNAMAFTCRECEQAVEVPRRA